MVSANEFAAGAARSAMSSRDVSSFQRKSTLTDMNTSGSVERFGGNGGRVEQRGSGVWGSVEECARWVGGARTSLLFGFLDA
jgi:hypothetical protein